MAKCVYFCYCKYCSKGYIQEKQEYGYTDLTDKECNYKNKFEACPEFKVGQVNPKLVK